MRFAALLFDLDGTLIDSAPDLAGAANEMREARGLGRLDLAELRPMVGSGARGMLGAAFGVAPGEADFETLRDEFLLRYEGRMTRETQLFEGVEELLAALDAARVPWGVVTNKIARFTEPLIDALDLRRRARTVVSGDSTGFSKPHPAPLLEAARRIGVPAHGCAYVGDDLRDVVAGRAAGMATAAASWGYLGAGPSIGSWDADVVLNTPHEVLKWLAMD